MREENEKPSQGVRERKKKRLGTAALCYDILIIANY